jgi:spoIIIJ-associated protein
MKKLEVTGKTIQEAINMGLLKWNVSLDRVIVDVIDHPTKGFIGFRSKEAKVELTLIPTVIDEANFFLENLFKVMNFSITVEEDINPDGPRLTLKGDQTGILIGKNGQTLDALQNIVNIVVNRHTSSFIRIQLDAENFRYQRKRTLERLATQMASKVINSNADVTLEPMNAFERKIIHYELQDHPIVKTYSIGDEPRRKVVISIK